MAFISILLLCNLRNFSHHSHPDMRYGYSTDVNIAFLPFFHSYGVVVYLCYMFISGATVVVMKEFDPIKYLTCCEKYKVSYSIANKNTYDRCVLCSCMLVCQ